MAGQSVIAKRVWIALACVLALAIGLGLAYWQWTRFESSSGTLQNLGYVLQWPLFGFFPAFMVWRIYRYARSEHTDEHSPTEAPVVSLSTSGGRSKMAYVAPTASTDTEDEDPALARYNAFLAELAAEDEEAAKSAERPSSERGGTSEEHEG